MIPFDAFVHVVSDAGSVQVSGTPRFFRGHRLPRSDGGCPDGVFADWQWDGERLIVRNDRYGAAPLFYWCDRSQVCVSPSLLAILQRGAPVEFDAAGLAAFFRLGYFLGEDTPFAHIRTVPPGSSLVWENGRLTGFGQRPRVTATATQREEAIDGFIALCRQSVRRRLPAGDAVVMPLSSGRDSRHILYELQAAGVRPQCVTVPRFAPRPGEDERIAPLVAAAAGLPHALLTQTTSRCAAEVRKNWATHLCADEHAWYMAVADAMRGRAHVMYDGLGGALSVPNRYHSFAALDLIDRGLTARLADQLITDYGVQSESFLRQVLRPEMYAELSRERAVERLAAELARHQAAPDPIKSFNFWNRIRRELALWPYAILRSVPTVFTPYLDHDVYDFLMGIPPTVMSPTLSDGKAFHTLAVHRAFPQYTHVPFEDKKAAKIDATAHNVRLTAEASRFVLARARHATRLLNRRFVLPRATYGVMRPSFGASRPWLPLASLYIMQLEMAAAGVIPDGEAIDADAATLPAAA